MGHPALSAIPMPPSATPSPVQNPQTLQQFPSLLYVASAHKPLDIVAHEGPPILLSDHGLSCVDTTMSHVVVCRYQSLNALRSIKDSLVRALRAVLPEDVAVDEESQRIADSKTVLMVVYVVWVI